ncbi:MAG: hypothetical protein AAFN43_12725, partial [Pseudomonadota bacterium]
MQPEQIEKLLLDALRKIDADQEDSRVKVYKAAIRAVDRSDPVKRDELHQHLLKTIELIEKKRAWAGRYIETSEPGFEAPDTRNRFNLVKLDPRLILQQRLIKPDSRWVVFIAIVVIGLASFFFWPTSDAEKSASEQARVTAIDDTAVSDERAQEPEANTDRVLVTISLPQDQAQITGQMMSDTQLPDEMAPYLQNGDFVISE